MSEYINADKLKDLFRYTEDAEYCTWTLSGVLSEIEEILEDDAIEVVRCKNCRYHEGEENGLVYCYATMECWVKSDWFCADGKNKDDSGGNRMTCEKCKHFDKTFYTHLLNGKYYQGICLISKDGCNSKYYEETDKVE